MAAGIELVTGYTGGVHITSEDDGGGYASIVGPGNYVSADVGRAMAAELPDANTARVFDGEAWFGGRHVRIPTGSYVDVPIESGTQGQQRHDVVAIRYTKDPATGQESCDLVCIKGTPGSSSAPATLSGSPLTGAASCDMPLYRIDLTGISPAAPVRLFTTMASAATRKIAASDISSGTLPVARGGTGAASADQACQNLIRGRPIWPQYLELGTGASGHGGYVDFHYNGSSADNTSRIIEESEGTISVNGARFPKSRVDIAYTKRSFSVGGGAFTGTVAWAMHAGIVQVDLLLVRRHDQVASTNLGYFPILADGTIPAAARPNDAVRSSLVVTNYNGGTDILRNSFVHVSAQGGVHASWFPSYTGRPVAQLQMTATLVYIAR